MPSKFLLFALVIAGGVSAGCSGGGGASTSTPTPTTASVKVYYDSPANTMLKEEGLVVVGPDGKPSDVKFGVWQTYFHPDIAGAKNVVESEKTYENGTWNPALAWTLFNADTSIRDSADDAVF